MLFSVLAQQLERKGPRRTTETPETGVNVVACACACAVPRSAQPAALPTPALRLRCLHWLCCLPVLSFVSLWCILQNASYCLHGLYVYKQLYIPRSGPNITLSHHTTTTPTVRNGTNYTLYQDFVTDDGDVQDLNITWTRVPFPLDSASNTFRIENTVINSRVLNASLILWDIQVVPTEGTYTVTASNGCGVSNKTDFYLDVEVCGQYDMPQPIILQNSTAIAEPDLGEVLQLTVTFHGPSSEDFVTLWSSGNSAICLENSDFHKTGFNCDRTVLGPCWFKANLWIHSPSYADSGEYSVYATDNGDDRGNSSTVNLSES